ncbi:MAG: dihydrolipoyl dehydrogenase [Candidatus Omnitrophica bacterium]|nr:dihydrolipoyl dehydrogenase [Candidatus Omnitrophota bacterium]MBU4488210.1 dihydrolipoyl dehydrogenase [Candidatus Omnitrophota bacterium]MCG2705387.1 dihydrolipoyl dehydrogenase [Candidatus Omnitrophota bacterium]
MSEKRDVAIIGAGPGGYVSAIRLSQLGKRPCVIDIDEARLGGVCLNEGCVSVKSLISNASKGRDIREMVSRSQEAVSALKSGLKSLFKKNGIEFISGKAKLLPGKKINVSQNGGKSAKIEADNIIIATGSSPNIPQGVIIDGESSITSNEAIKLEKLPKTMLVVGAGAIGVELASLFFRLGTKVTLIEALSRILPFEDEEVSKALARILAKKGMEVLTGRTIEPADKTAFEKILVVTGRKPNIDGLGLEDAGVKTKDGFIACDGKMRTSVKGIYAAGDVLNTPMYAHVAYREGIIAAEDICGVKVEPIDYENVPHVIFSDPEVAGVGLTEIQAKEGGYDIAVSKYFFKANAKAVIGKKDDGFVKIIADKKTRKLLGVHIIGEGATEIIHEFVLAKSAGLTVDAITKMVHAHPTLSEIAGEGAMAVFGKPIHG